MKIPYLILSFKQKKKIKNISIFVIIKINRHQEIVIDLVSNTKEFRKLDKLKLNRSMY